MDIGDAEVLVCPTCGNRTPHKLVFQHTYFATWYSSDGTVSNDEGAPATIYMVFEFLTCHDISLYHHLEPLDFENPELLYPKGDSLHESVPVEVGSNFSQAKRVQAISPNAFAVLVRRSLEALVMTGAFQPGF